MRLKILFHEVIQRVKTSFRNIFRHRQRALDLADAGTDTEPGSVCRRVVFHGDWRSEDFFGKGSDLPQGRQSPKAGIFRPYDRKTGSRNEGPEWGGVG